MELGPKPVLTTVTLLGVIYTASVSGGYGLEDAVKGGGPFLTIAFVILLPLVWAMPVSLCVAELSCSMPSNAGPIMWINSTFPEWVSFLVVNWTLMLNCIDSSLYPTLFGDYVATMFSVSPIVKAFLKIVFISACAGINIVGIHFVGFISLFVMCVTVLPFALMILLQLPFGVNWERVAYVPATVDWPLFLPVVCWSFSGFENVSHLVEEIHQPDVTFVRAILMSMMAGWLTYIPPLVVGASTTRLLHIPFESWGDGFWVIVGEAVGGRTLGMIVFLGSLVSTFGLLTTILATSSRSIAGIGSLNGLPTKVSEYVSRYHPKYMTPVNAIVLNSLFITLFSLLGSFETLVGIGQMLYALRLIAILVCYLRIHQARPGLARPFTVPGGTFGAYLCATLPLLISLVVVFVIASRSYLTIISFAAVILFPLLGSYVLRRPPAGFLAE